MKNEYLKTKTTVSLINYHFVFCPRYRRKIFLQAPPTLSPSKIMAKIKGTSSRVLRKEFECLSHQVSLWTRSFFVSTAGKVSNKVVKKYIEMQKKNG